MFNINVPSSIYAKYYFDLRTIADENNYIFPAEPLSIERAKKLEVISINFLSLYFRYGKNIYHITYNLHMLIDILYDCIFYRP